MLGGFHKIKDQMLVSMTLYIFPSTSPSSGVQMYMFHLEPTPLSLNKIVRGSAPSSFITYKKSAIKGRGRSESVCTPCSLRTGSV